MLFRLIEEVRVFYLQLMAFLVKIELSLLHCLLMLLLKLFDLFCMLSVKRFYFTADRVITLDFEIYFILMIFFELVNLFLIFFLLIFQFICELLMFFERILNV